MAERLGDVLYVLGCIAASAVLVLWLRCSQSQIHGDAAMSGSGLISADLPCGTAAKQPDLSDRPTSNTKRHRPTVGNRGLSSNRLYAVEFFAARRACCRVYFPPIKSFSSSGSLAIFAAIRRVMVLSRPRSPEWCVFLRQLHVRREQSRRSIVESNNLADTLGFCVDQLGAFW
jgi:hypothetical protein